MLHFRRDIICKKIEGITFIRLLRAIMRYLIVLLLTLFLTTALGNEGCECQVSAENMKKDANEADIVVEGKYLANLSEQDGTDPIKCYNIMFLVSSVIQGKVLSDTIAINQLDQGRCLIEFESNKKYVLLGYSIERFKSGDPTLEEPLAVDEIQSTNQPPPVWYLKKKKTMMLFGYSKDEIEYWNTLTESYGVFHTHLCAAFESDSKNGKILSGLKN